MKYPDNTHFKKPTQERSLKAIEDILDAAKALSDEGVLDLPNARDLSAKSGYSTATIYRYFEKLDDVFLSLFMWRRNKAIALVSQVIDAHDPQSDIEALITRLVDIGMDEWASKNPKILRLVIRQFFRHTKEPEKFNTLMDELMPSMLAAQKRDQSNTFRQMTDNELRLQVRALQMAIRNPFFEQDPFAGSSEHRRWTIEMGIRLLGKSAT